MLSLSLSLSVYVCLYVCDLASVGATISAVSVRHVTESLSRLESTVDTALHDVDNYLDAGSKVSVLSTWAFNAQLALFAASVFHSE